MSEAWKYYKSLLTSWRWRKLRHAKLSACPLCERCISEGRRVPNIATDVHHIVPVMKAAPDKGRMEVLCFDVHNLRALCPECHKKTHEEMKMHVGRQQRRAIRKEQLDAFKRKFFNNNESNDK